MPVSEYEEAVLRLIQSRSLTIENIIEKFNGVFSSKQVKDLVRALRQRKYIKVEQHLVCAVYSPGDSIDDARVDDYVLTPLGNNYLANATANFTSFSHISNSNIANQSAHVEQKLDFSELSADVREKLDELKDAIQRKDGNALTKAFTYIADKSVDVAIAILVGMNK
jgi:hypothetical protein